MKRSGQRLNKRVVDSFTYAKPIEEGARSAPQDIRWDSDLPGFGVRIYPSGRKTFVLSYRHQGRKHIMQLGEHGKMTIKQARDKAIEKLAEVVDKKDPMEEVRRTRQGSKVKDLCKMYLERHASQKRSGSEDERRIEKRIKPAWGGWPVASVTRAHVAELHHQVGERTPYEANRTLALIKKMWNLARQWGFLDESAPNPAQGIQAFREVSRDRYVTPQELPELAKAIDEEPNLYTRAAIWLYLLTGMRKTEVLQLEWNDIDSERREIRLGTTKGGRPHYIPLSPPVVALLEALPREEGNPYALPGMKDKSHLVNINKAWKRIRTAAGIEDVRLHDLRRTVGSWLAQSGEDLHLIGRVLGHRTLSTTQVYARFAQDQVRVALDKHAEHILEVAKGLRVVKG